MRPKLPGAFLVYRGRLRRFGLDRHVWIPMRRSDRSRDTVSALLLINQMEEHDFPEPLSHGRGNVPASPHHLPARTSE